MPYACPSLQHLCLEQDQQQRAQVLLRYDTQVLSGALKPSSPCATLRLLSVHLEHTIWTSFFHCPSPGDARDQEHKKWCGDSVFLPGAEGSTGQISRHPAAPGNRPGWGQRGLWKEAVVFISSRRGNPARQLLHQCWSFPGTASSC